MLMAFHSNRKAMLLAVFAFLIALGVAAGLALR